MEKIQKEDIGRFANEFPLSKCLQGKRFFIDGVTGLLGSNMVHALLALNRHHNLGMTITACARNINKAKGLFGNENNVLRYYSYDFNNSLNFMPPPTDYCIHLASPTSGTVFSSHPVETLVTSFNGIRNILEYGKKNRIASILYVSSMEVYGMVTNEEALISEDIQGYVNPLNTRSSYPIGKRVAENLCHAYASEFNVPVKIARLSQTFGAGTSPNDKRVTSQFARSIVKGEDIILHTEGLSSSCHCYTMDAISAFLYILLKGENGEAYNVANEETYCSIREMAEYMSNYNKTTKVRIELSNIHGYAPQTHLRLSVEKLRALGWIPKYDKHEMFQRLIESMKSN